MFFCYGCIFPSLGNIQDVLCILLNEVHQHQPDRFSIFGNLRISSNIFKKNLWVRMCDVEMVKVQFKTDRKLIPLKYFRFLLMFCIDVFVCLQMLKPVTMPTVSTAVRYPRGWSNAPVRRQGYGWDQTDAPVSVSQFSCIRKHWLRRSLSSTSLSFSADINECASGRGVCPHRRKCVNTFGSFLCKCHLGFKLTYINGRYICIGEASSVCINLPLNGSDFVLVLTSCIIFV